MVFFGLNFSSREVLDSVAKKAARFICGICCTIVLTLAISMMISLLGFNNLLSHSGMGPLTQHVQGSRFVSFVLEWERCDQRTPPEGLSGPFRRMQPAAPHRVRFGLRASKPLKVLSFPVARTNAKLSLQDVRFP